MKKIFLFLLMILTVSGCGNGSTQPAPATKSEKISEQPTSTKTGGKILVVYFSRAGENYEVGNISKGNTHIVAEMIAEKTGGDLFEIKPATPYPDNYEACTEIAKQELQENLRPEYIGKVENFSDYDTIFLGFPIWWSDLPMIVYTFLEANDFKGKTIIPFCTSAGNVMTGKEKDITNFAKGANLLEGIGIKGKRCQDEPDKVKVEVNNWLQELGY